MLIMSIGRGIGFTPQQQRLKQIADLIVLQDKIRRQNLIEEMKAIIRTLTAEQLIAVINAVDSPVALRFFVPSGAFGEARILLFARIELLEKQGKR